VFHVENPADAQGAKEFLETMLRETLATHFKLTHQSFLVFVRPAEDVLEISAILDAMQIDSDVYDSESDYTALLNRMCAEIRTKYLQHFGEKNIKKEVERIYLLGYYVSKYPDIRASIPQ
jgi:hypothetical protein